jgi:hypothetical protein
MNSLTVGLISAGSIFGGALFGMQLQRVLPGHHLAKEMQNLVKLSAGTIATLTALVLGLLVSSAKSSFDAINTDIVQSSAKIVIPDHALARYGPETRPVREQLKRVMAASIETIWPTEKTGARGLTVLERANGVELIQDKLRELTPQNDAQRQFLAQAQQIAGDLGQTRWLLIEQAQSELPLLIILVFWLVLLFVSFGLFASAQCHCRHGAICGRLRHLRRHFSRHRAEPAFGGADQGLQRPAPERPEPPCRMMPA